jgi:outer membrane lipoprotein SlyB
VGEAVEEAVTRKRAQENTIQMKDGRTVVITQEAPPEYRVGDEVQVIHSPAGARVAMATDY